MFREDIKGGMVTEWGLYQMLSITPPSFSLPNSKVVELLSLWTMLRAQDGPQIAGHRSHLCRRLSINCSGSWRLMALTVFESRPDRFLRWKKGHFSYRSLSHSGTTEAMPQAGVSVCMCRWHSALGEREWEKLDETEEEAKQRCHLNRIKLQSNP